MFCTEYFWKKKERKLINLIEFTGIATTSFRADRRSKVVASGREQGEAAPP